MSKVFMTKSSSDAEWGFDLDIVANGQDDSSWITISKVDEDSPSYGKLEVGDRVLEIAGNTTSNISLINAWDLIKKCSNALFLTIKRKGAEPPVDQPMATETTTIRAMATAHELATQTPKKPGLLRRTSVDAKDFMRPKNAASTEYNETEARRDSEPSIPVAPPLTADWMKKVYRKPSVKGALSPDGQKQLDEFERRIPDKLLSTMTKPGMRPFTYTPRGVDLQEVVEKARSRRHAHRMAHTVQPEERQVEQIIETSHNAPSALTVQQMSSSFSGQPWNAPVSQSKSFQRLRGWVEDNALASPATGQTEVMTKSPVALALEQSGVISNPTNRTIPSNAFRILQQSCGPDLSHNVQALSIEQEKYNKERATQELYRRVPARDREREPEAHKYQGADIPSRSFRFLQEHTTSETTPGPVYATAPERPAPYEDKHANVPSRSFRLLQQLSGEGSSLQPPGPRLRNAVKSNARVYSTEF